MGCKQISSIGPIIVLYCSYVFAQKLDQVRPAELAVIRRPPVRGPCPCVCLDAFPVTAKHDEPALRMRLNLAFQADILPGILDRGCRINAYFLAFVEGKGARIGISGRADQPQDGCGRVMPIDPAVSAVRFAQ